MFWIVVFFVYGLAFFTMGIALAIECRRSSAALLVSSLVYLAAFALIHSATEWMDMFLLIGSQLGPAGDSNDLLRGLKLLSLAVSSVCLIQFAVKLLINSTKKHRWLALVPFVLFAGWLFSFFVPHFYLIPVGDVSATGLCLQCHRGDAGLLWTLSSGWMTRADIGARYILYLPGSFLAALAMLSLRSGFVQMRLNHLRLYAIIGAVAFIANAFVAGIVVPPSQYFPASLVNYASFFHLFGVPPQVIRTLVALTLAYVVIKISSVFEIQQRRRLERAQRQRLEAQQHALESQRMAQQQLEQWNRELEVKIEQRTKEVEQQRIEMAILEERDRIAREMHDSLGQILGYLGLKLMETRQFLTASKLQQAVDNLQQMSEAVQGACADVRESILSLRTSISNGGLQSALEEYVDKFGDQAGIKTKILVEPGTELGLSPVAEVQVLRIVQEALTNIRKHAKARNALVRVSGQNGDTLLTIEDDGRGFDLDFVVQQKGAHFGLQTMRERANAIGASFVVKTALGKGTTVEIGIPKSKGGDGRGS
jgi:signal transduction histidine kinase